MPDQKDASSDLFEATAGQKDAMVHLFSPMSDQNDPLPEHFGPLLHLLDPKAHMQGAPEEVKAAGFHFLTRGSKHKKLVLINFLTQFIDHYRTLPHYLRKLNIRC